MNPTTHTAAFSSPYAKTAKKLLLVTAASCAFLTGCQSLPTASTPTTTNIANAPIAFNISGKIGITSVSSDGNQSGTAFYSWAQDGERFAIDLTGALGIGATSISYDGKTATLDSERTGVMTATTPEELLHQATGWQAPISQLPYWVLGRAAPSDSTHEHDSQGRLTTATNGDWTAKFEYKGNTPNRLRITHADGSRVIMSIVHGK